MADHTQIKFRAAGWSDAAARDLSTIADAQSRDLMIFETQVRSGAWQLWEIEYQGERLGCLIWSVEREGRDHALIINAAAARPIRGLDVSQAMFDAFCALGAKTGAQAIRCWTRREGLRRKLERLGAQARYVMEIEL